MNRDRRKDPPPGAGEGAPAVRDERSRAIQQMFNRIAGRYDLMNRLMTFGQDRVWQRCVARRAMVPPGGRLLDIGAGTGGIAAEALAVEASIRVAAADFSLDMIRAGRRRFRSGGPYWCNADALDLPFPDRTFDAVTSGYLIRNVTDKRRAFAEQARVVKPGGRVICLDTSPPRRNPLYPMVLFHLKVVIPRIGGWISGEPGAYRYLPESTRAFMSVRDLAGTMRSAGLVDVHHRSFMFGTIAVHAGRRPA